MSNNDQRENLNVPLADLTCGFTHDGARCPIAVSVLHEATWLCSRHFRHLRRDQSLEAISFLYEVLGNVRKYTHHADHKEFWLEEEMRNYNLNPELWKSQMPKPSAIPGGLVAGESRKASVLIEKTISEISGLKLPEIEVKPQISREDDDLLAEYGL